MITTTLNRIRAHHPCEEGWSKLLKHLGKTKGDDEQLPFSVIVESNGLEDALWCCQAEPQREREWRVYAVWCARQVQHLMADQRSIDALAVAERHANGEATDAELHAARADARAAASAAAWDAARAAVPDAARDAAWAAARAAARAAAMDVAMDAAMDVAWDVARAVAMDAAMDAAMDVAWDAQRVKFMEVVG